jgi:hypothetical protein
MGAATLDTGRISDAIVGLAEGGIDADALGRVVEDKLALIRDGHLPGVAWLTDLMDAAATKARGRFGPDLVIFRKVLQTLNGVVADVSEESRADAVLAASLVSRLGMEMPGRMIARPLSRTFPTHLSNADLAHLSMSAPLIVSRYWLSLWQDIPRGDPSKSGPRPSD